MSGRFRLRLAARILPILMALGLAAPASAGGEVNIYSYREPKLMAPLLKAFTAKTGIKANMIYAGSGLVERIAAEGRNSPADVLLTNEFGLLVQAVSAGVTQGIASPELEAAIPAAYRDPAGHWFGLTKRARVVTGRQCSPGCAAAMGWTPARRKMPKSHRPACPWQRPIESIRKGRSPKRPRLCFAPPDW